MKEAVEKLFEMPFPQPLVGEGLFVEEATGGAYTACACG
jgi:hypothetical protein